MSVAISEHMLPDGSTAVVGVQGTRVCVERRVGDRQVWVTVIDHTDRHERDRQVSETLGRMRESPAAFDHSQAWARAGSGV